MQERKLRITENVFESLSETIDIDQYYRKTEKFEHFEACWENNFLVKTQNFNGSYSFTETYWLIVDITILFLLHISHIRAYFLAGKWGCQSNR